MTQLGYLEDGVRMEEEADERNRQIQRVDSGGPLVNAKEPRVDFKACFYTKAEQSIRDSQTVSKTTRPFLLLSIMSLLQANSLNFYFDVPLAWHRQYAWILLDNVFFLLSKVLFPIVLIRAFSQPSRRLKQANLNSNGLWVRMDSRWAPILQKLHYPMIIRSREKSRR